MIREIVVLLLVAFGFLACVRGPFFALLFYLWLAYFRPDKWLWNDWISSLHLSFIVGVVLIGLTALFISKIRLTLTWPIPLLILFFIQTLISTVASEHTNWSWDWWFDFARVMLIGYLIILHVNTTKRMRWTICMITLSLGLEAAKQGWVGFILHAGAKNMNTHPIFGDNNGIALGTFMLVPVIIALIRTAEKKWEKWLYWFLLVGVVLRGISTYSRGGFVAASALVLVLLLRSRHRIRTAIAIAIVSFFVLSVMPQSFWDRMRTLQATDKDQSAAGRLHFWAVATTMASQHPFTGVGFNGFSRSYNTYDKAGGFGTERAVHSTWFGMLSETGYPGLILFLTVLFFSFLLCHRVASWARGRPDENTIREIANGFLGGFVVYVIGGTFINGQYNEMFWHWVFLTVAMANISTRIAEQTPVAELENGFELNPESSATAAV